MCDDNQQEGQDDNEMRHDCTTHFQVEIDFNCFFFCFVVFMRENVSADYRKNTLKYIINFSTAHSSATISLL